MIPEVVGWWALAVIVGVIVLSAAGYGAVRAWRWWRDRQAEQAFQKLSEQARSIIDERPMMNLTEAQWAELRRRFPPAPKPHTYAPWGQLDYLTGVPVVVVEDQEKSSMPWWRP